MRACSLRCCSACSGDKVVANPPSGVAWTPPKPVETVKGLKALAACASSPISLAPAAKPDPMPDNLDI